MILLPSHHYSPVILEKAKSSLIFSYFFNDDIEENILMAVHAPSTLDKNEYDNWFKDKRFARTELFDSSWNLGHLGSARNYFYSDLQVKGCGRTLPSQHFVHLENSGLMPIQNTLHSFINSHLADTTLPLGCHKGRAALKWKYVPGAGVFVRDMIFPRLAQLGPHLPLTFRQKLISELEVFHCSKDPEVWLKKIMAQLAALTYLGLKFQPTPDNFAIHGQPLDEEEWFWPETMNDDILYLELALPQNDHELENWHELKIEASSVHNVKKMIHFVLKGHSYILKGVELPSYEKMERSFLEHLSSLGASETFTTLWDKSDREILLSLKKYPFNIIQAPEMKRLNVIVTVPRKNVHPFNQFKRPRFFTECERLSSFIIAGLTDGMSQNLSNKIFTQIGKSGFVLATKPDQRGNPQENTSSLDQIIPSQEHLIKIWNEGHEKVFTFTGEQNLLPKGSVPLSLKINDVEVPLKKCFLQTLSK